MNELTTKSNEELLQILMEGEDIHSEAVIMNAEVILQERDVQYTVPFRKAKSKAQGKVQTNSEVSARIADSGFVYAPILLAVLFLSSPFLFEYFITIPRGANPEHLFYLGVGFLVFKRIVVLAIIDYYNKKLGISGMLWYVLGLIFGSWTLLAYNIYLWVQTGTKTENQPLDSSIDE